MAAGTAVLAAGTAATLILGSKYGMNTTAKNVIAGIAGVGALGCLKATQWSISAYKAFSYNGKRKLSKQIIDGTAEYVTLPEGGLGLDVGCGSGALTIACAKRNPQGKMIGIDRWGREYKSFSKQLCESRKTWQSENF